jgi:SAM-dependent methyltransferase
VELTLGTWRISVERTPPTSAELAAMYDAAAECWHERLALLGYPRAYEDLFGRLLADGTLRSLRDGGRVLDCGMGTGAFGLALAGKVAAPLRVEGVDISPSMLLRASLNLDRAGIGARMHLRDVNDLAFEDGTFDAVVGAHVLEHLDDPFARLAEMARVLKPRGPLIIVVARRGLPDALLRLRWRHARIDQARLVREMEEVGFSDVRPHRSWRSPAPSNERRICGVQETPGLRRPRRRQANRRDQQAFRARRNGVNERPQTPIRARPIGGTEEGR